MSDIVTKLKLLPPWDDEDTYGQLISIEGTEKLSELFEYKLRILTTKESISEEETFNNKEIGFAIEHYEDDKLVEEKGRYFHGVIVEVLERCISARRPKKGYITYEYGLKVRPKLHLVSNINAVDTNAFFGEEQNLIDIIEKEILKKHKIEFKFDDNITNDKDKFVAHNCIQFNETPFAFLTRLLSLAGFYYFFKHEKGKHTMIISNANTSYLDSVEVTNRADNLNSNHSSGIYSLVLGRRGYGEEWSTNAFTFAKYSKPVQKKHKKQAHDKQESLSSTSGKVIYMTEAEDVSEIERMTEMRSNVGNNISEYIKGRCFDKNFVVGLKIKLAETSLNDEILSPFKKLVNKEYAIVSLNFSVSHKGSYSADFMAIPKDLILLPLEKTAKHYVGPHQGTVINNSKEKKDDLPEPFLFKKGMCYVYVKLEAWKNEDHCVVRGLVVTDFNSNNIPKPGTKVKVEFQQTESYADIPHVTGQYNSEVSEIVDYEKEDHYTYSVYTAFHTEKEKDFFNYMLSIDKKDLSRFVVFVQKFMDVVVKDTRVTIIDEKPDLKHDQCKREKVPDQTAEDKDLYMLKKGNLREVICEGDHVEEIKKGNKKQTLVKGDYTGEIKDGQKEQTIKKDYILNIDGDMKVNVKGNMIFDVQGDIKKASKGKMNLESGGDLGIKSGGDLNQEATGTLNAKGMEINHKASANMGVKAGANLELKGAMVNIN